MKGSRVPFLNAVTRIVCGCFLYCDLIFRPENKDLKMLCNVHIKAINNNLNTF
jgi:hypothetical protein